MDSDTRSIFSTAPPSYDENWSHRIEEPERAQNPPPPPPPTQPGPSFVNSPRTDHQYSPSGGPPEYASDHIQTTQGTLYASSEGEVVLTWNPPPTPLHDPRSPTRPSIPQNARASSSSTVSTLQPRARIPAPAPPSSEPITYTFSPSSFNSMLLLPPATAADSRPLYHISVHQNCFIPTSFATVLRRGASEQGQMGISDESSTVTMDDTQRLLSKVLTQVTVYGYVRDQKQFRWKFGDTEVNWTVSLLKPMVKATCTLKAAGRNGPELAVLVPANMQDPVWRGERRLTTIRITPAAEPYIDHILVSALVLERMRLTPRGFEDLFNFANYTR
ncbi:hypothetical protein EVG20_g2723 [Dentipellis fragilis]|uniref:Uncharacterized protein n=1 Tax=Dentipellis fragilis TaxID=205917 RepID=A0A4Y9Z8C3_9AGAM|nr:hypothetical protein EVG20_g2723 [Dentipellis fragilis]